MAQKTHNVFKTNAVTGVYAQALYELSDAAGSLDAVADEMDRLADLLAGNAELLGLLSSKALSREARDGVIDRVFKGRVSDVVVRFLQVLNRKGRLDVLPGITASFADRVAQRRGIVEVDVIVAQRLDGSTADEIAASIGRALGGKQVVLHQYVDESIIGGLQIRVGDRLIDGSVASQLERMRRDLIRAGRQAARGTASQE